MYNALYIDDEKSPFVVSLLEELRKKDIQCNFQYWNEVACNARVASGIDFKKLAINLGLEEPDSAANYDSLILDIMMPSEGMIGTKDGLLTGIKLHEKLLKESPSIAKIKTFFITNLPMNCAPYEFAEAYVIKIDGTLLRKGSAVRIADRIKNTISIGK